LQAITGSKPTNPATSYFQKKKKLEDKIMYGSLTQKKLKIYKYIIIKTQSASYNDLQEKTDHS